MEATIRTPEPITLADYDESWAQEFLQIRSSLLDATRGRLLQVEAIGSTSIEGMPAQPVIDILAVRDPEVALEELVPRIEGVNFRPFGEFADAGERVLGLRKPRFGTVTHQVFLILPGDPFRDQSLNFRDWLRRNPADAARYADLRYYLAELFADSPDNYRRGKLGFFRHIQGLHEAAAATF